MIQDFESSGLIDLAAKDYRVIVFDRPMIPPAPLQASPSREVRETGA
jgi:hypothetical protein